MKKILVSILSLALAATAFTACGDKDDDNDKKSGSKVITEDDLTHANGNAKIAYNGVAGVAMDMVIDGITDFSGIVGVYKYPDFDGPNEKMTKELQDSFSDDTDFSGEFYVGTDDRLDIPFVQWRPDENSELVGQYPHGSDNVDKLPEWGTYK